MFKKSFSALCIALPLLSCMTMNASSPPTDIETVVKELDAYMKEKMAQTWVIGAAVAVVYKDKVVWLEGYGYRKVNGVEKVDADTVFKLASLSKPIASTIVASLIGTDGIRWDAPVREYDFEFALSNATATREVTPRNFFSHSSRLPTTGGDVLEDLGYTRPEVLSKLRLVPLKGEVGKTYHYSNFGLTEAATAVSIRLKKPWEKIAEDQLYSKLGMSSTSSRFSDYENNANKAAIHFADCDQEDHCVFRNWFTRDADAESPAGGVSSSARDLAKWLQMQLAGGSFNGRQIVARTALEETRKPVICSSVDVLQPGQPCLRNSYYGLGWGVGKTSWGATTNSHSGAFLLGTGTAVYMIPDEQIGIIVVTNSSPVGLPEAAALTFLDEYHYGKSTQDWLKVVQPSFVALRKEAQDSSPNYSTMKRPPLSTPSKGLSFYTGKYFNLFYGTLEVR
jgi:CubicO group peptidase (beta-lactamase class C family)